MVVRRLAAASSRYEPLVVGRSFDGSRFPGIAFEPLSVDNWLPLSATQRYAVAAARTLRRLPPGLIEVHNKPDVASWLARLFPQRPVGLILHNDPRSMRGARSIRARAALMHRLAYIATVSEFVKGAFLDGSARTPVRAPVVVHNALDFSAIPAGLAHGARDRVILFVGRVVADKGADLFVAACARALPALPGWRAEIIGADGFSARSPETPFIRTLRPAAKAAGVAMLGYQPADAVIRAMSRAAIVVVPSRWQEPFGLTALEAMACGAALVCSGRGGLAEIMGEAGLLIDPDDIDGFAQALIRLASDAALRANLSSAGLVRAHTRFSIVDAIKALDDLRDIGLLRSAPATRSPSPA